MKTFARIKRVSEVASYKISFDKDYFGIANLTNKDISGKISNSSTTSESIAQKYALLSVPRNEIKNKEKFDETHYGQVRRDEDNIVDIHGKYEETNQQYLVDKKVVLDEFKLNLPASDQTPDNPNLNEENSATTKENIGNPEIPLRYTKPIKSLNEVLADFKLSSSISSKDSTKNVSPLQFQFKFAIHNSDRTDTAMPKYSDSHTYYEDKNESERPIIGTSIDENKHADIKELYKNESDFEDDVNFDLDFDVNLDKEYEEQRKPKEPTPAIEYLNQIRNEKVQRIIDRSVNELKSDDPYPLSYKVCLDMKGFNTFKGQTVDWSKCLRSEILDFLKKSIIYHNYDVLAINKPYGLNSHRNRKDTSKLDIDSLMQELAPRLRVERLYLAHRLDKTTSGVLLFATSQQRADHLNKLFLSGQIKKKYWCITKGRPNPEHAIIDIPIGEQIINGKSRRCLVPEAIERFKQLTSKVTDSKRAITEYKVLHSASETSLVEVYPRTGVKHQIRCHMGFGLRTPILGDHKYSHLDRMLPQKLHQLTLNALHVRQEKVRTLPLHLHARTIVIPDVKPNKENLFIHANLPRYFRDNMKNLKLNAPFT